jgi:hypothetical protein
VKQTKYFIKGKYIVAEISKKNIADWTCKFWIVRKW